MMRIFFILFFISTSTAFAESNLPKHTIDKQLRLKNGTKLQINSTDENLTKDQCIDLIKAYRYIAAPKGQITVRKPSKMKVLKGTVAPYCLDNFDGKGIIFDSDFHPELKVN